MIVLILFLTTLGAVSAEQDHQYPDFYAVAIRTKGFLYGYKVFKRRMDCTDPVYVYDYDSDDNNRVLMKVDKKWIIGSLDDDLECQNVASKVGKNYESKGSTPTDGYDWINIKESTMVNQRKAYVGIRSLNKCELKKGLRLETTTSLFSMEDCESKDYWATNYPDKTVFVSIKTGDLQCSFDVRKDVRLFHDNSAKLFIHSSCGRDENGGAEEQQNKNGRKDKDSSNNPYEIKSV